MTSKFRKISIPASGIGVMVNTFPSRNNAESSPYPTYDPFFDATTDFEAGAVTYREGLSMTYTLPIVAGEEIFVDYSRQWISIVEGLLTGLRKGISSHMPNLNWITKSMLTLKNIFFVII